MKTKHVTKEALVSPLVPALPSSTGHMRLDTDEYDKQVRCVLLQKQEEETSKTIEGRSPKGNNAGKRCDTTRRELLAIV